MKSGPYRGIFSEVARDLGLKRSTVKKAYDRRTPRIVKAVARKIAQRNRIMNQHAKVSKTA